MGRRRVPREEPMAEIVLDHVSKVYSDGTAAVSDLSLDIRDGEFIVLVGPSGCGKTTALRMVAGLESITDGTISIDDMVVNTVPPKERDIAMVFQNYALYPHMTVYDNMAFGLKLRKLSKQEIDRRVREAAKILGLDDFLERKPTALSGGQRQRVAMGRAIVREPKAFPMDEPLSNLDAKLREQMRSEIVGIRPEYMEDASLASQASDDRLRSTVDLREALGSDVVVHFKVKAPIVLTEDVKELAHDVGAEALEAVEQEAQQGESTFVARLNPRTKAKQGEPIELTVDVGRMHFFDPDTGLGIYEDGA